MKRYIKINENDNVIVALADLQTGEDIGGVKALEEIPSGHKMAVTDIKKGEAVIKYGYRIGNAK